MAKTKDMTVGNPTKLLLGFALPMMLGNLFQQAYSLVDTIIVGRFVGVEALAAIGNAAWLDWLVMGIVIGLAQGFAIFMAQRFGATDYEGLRKSVAMATIMSLVVAMLMTFLSVFYLKNVLIMMNAPENTIDITYNYLKILFSGTTIIVAYNLIFSILRALGDSKTPLYAMATAAILNVVGDLLLVVGFNMGVNGAAIATVFAQFCALLLCLNAVRKLTVAMPHKKDWIPDLYIAKRLMQLGLPIAFQNGIIAVGGLVLQSIINKFGYIFVAGVTAANKVCGLMEMGGTALGFAAGTFTGQNLGAEKYERIREGVRSAVKIAIASAVIVGAAVAVFGKPILLMFISGEESIVQRALDASYPYLVTMCVSMFMLYLLFVYRSTLQGMGDTTVPLISSIVELIARIAFALILPIFLHEFGIYIAEVSAWVGAAVLLMIMYYKRINKVDPIKHNS